jgi:hypothetical protein
MRRPLPVVTLANRSLPILEDFLGSTTPGHVPEAHWRELLVNASPDDKSEDAPLRDGEAVGRPSHPWDL